MQLNEKGIPELHRKKALSAIPDSSHLAITNILFTKLSYLYRITFTHLCVRASFINSNFFMEPIMAPIFAVVDKQIVLKY